MRGFVHVSLRQGTGMLIAAGGSIVLARYLGAALLGVHSVSTFFLGFLSLVLDFGTSQFLLRTPREDLDDSLIRVVFTVRLILAAAIVALALLVVGPLLSWWYQTVTLYWLLSSSVVAAAIAWPFRISINLLEKDMDYARVGVVELLGTIGFFLPASVLAYLGFGVSALIAGEVIRGLSTLAACAFRPFSPGLALERRRLVAAGEFGLGYLSGALAWSLTAGVNPLIVAKLAGLEAAGYVRVAEGIVTQLTAFKAVTERIFYPLLAEIRNEPSRVVHLVSRWRVAQFVIGVLPLLAVTAVGAWLVPLVYGRAWSPVANALLPLSLNVGISTIFASFTGALIVSGRTWQTTRFHVVYTVVLWIVSPALVSSFGYLGYPIALLLASPCYALLQRDFSRAYGKPQTVEMLQIVCGCWLATLAAWSLPHWTLAALAFSAGLGLVAALLPHLRGSLREVWALRRSLVPLGPRS